MSHAFTFNAVRCANTPDHSFPLHSRSRNPRWTDSLARAVALGIGPAWLIALALLSPSAAQSVEAPPQRLPAVSGAPFEQIEDLCLKEKKARIMAEEDEIKQDLAKSGKPYDSERLRKRLKAIPYEICDRWVRHYYTDHQIADQLVALRDGIDRQKDAAWEGFLSRYRWLQVHQWAVVVLGLLATVLTARASRPKSTSSDGNSGTTTGSWTWSSAFAVLLTAIVTAMGSMAGFYDLRGAVERNAKVLVTMGELQSRIDDQLMANLLPQEPEKPAGPTTMPGRIRQWSLERDKALKAASDEWTKAVTSTGR